MEARRNSTETPTVGPRPKVWTRDQRWRAWEAQMRYNPEGGELDPVFGDRRRCKKNSLPFYPAESIRGQGVFLGYARKDQFL